MNNLDYILRDIEEHYFIKFYPEISRANLVNGALHTFNNTIINLCGNNNYLRRSNYNYEEQFFKLIDSYIDKNFPCFEGKYYLEKYNSLEKSNDSEIIFAEIYRCMVIIRNSTTHNKSFIQENNGKTSYKSYNKAQTEYYEIRISNFALSILFLYIYLIVKTKDFNSFYYMGIYRQLYDVIKNDIIIKDKKGDSLDNIQDGLKLNINQRCTIMNTIYHINHSVIKIERYKKCGATGFDYYFKHEENEYLIPDEVLDENDNLLLNDLENWIYPTNHLFYERKIKQKS